MLRNQDDKCPLGESLPYGVRTVLLDAARRATIRLPDGAPGVMVELPPPVQASPVPLPTTATHQREDIGCYPRFVGRPDSCSLYGKTMVISCLN